MKILQLPKFLLDLHTSHRWRSQARCQQLFLLLFVLLPVLPTPSKVSRSVHRPQRLCPLLKANFLFSHQVSESVKIVAFVDFRKKLRKQNFKSSILLYLFVRQLAFFLALFWLFDRNLGHLATQQVLFIPASSPRELGSYFQSGRGDRKRAKGTVSQIYKTFCLCLFLRKKTR